MRILVISDLYPPVATGGYERSCADVVARWRRDGHTVTVLTTEGPTGGSDGVRRTLPFVPTGHGDDAEAATTRAALAAAFEQARPDVVSAWNLARVGQREVLGAVAASGRPLVVVACDGWLADAPADLPRQAPGSRVVWVSEALRAATRVPPWVPDEHVVVGSGVDPTVFPVLTPAPRLWRGRLLFVGRLSPAKGVDDALAALTHLGDDGTTLRVVGPGDPGRREALTADAARLGVAHRVTFDVAERDALPAVYAGADALLFPSRWAEPFGLVPLEAMACGTPVVATGTGGSASYLRDGTNALLVPPSDPPALAAAVRRLAADPRLRARLVAGGARTSSGHDIDRTAGALALEHERAARTSR